MWIISSFVNLFLLWKHLRLYCEDPPAHLLLSEGQVVEEKDSKPTRVTEKNRVTDKTIVRGIIRVTVIIRATVIIRVTDKIRVTSKNLVKTSTRITDNSKMKDKIRMTVKIRMKDKIRATNKSRVTDSNRVTDNTKMKKIWEIQIMMGKDLHLIKALTQMHPNKAQNFPTWKYMTAGTGGYVVAMWARKKTLVMKGTQKIRTMTGGWQCMQLKSGLNTE
jgi:hypothetical protein